MEKPGRPEGAPRRLNPKGPINAGFDQALWGVPKVARMARKRKACLSPFPTFWQEGNEAEDDVCHSPPLALSGRGGEAASPVREVHPSPNAV